MLCPCCARRIKPHKPILWVPVLGLHNQDDTKYLMCKLLFFPQYVLRRTYPLNFTSRLPTLNCSRINTKCNSTDYYSSLSHFSVSILFYLYLTVLFISKYRLTNYLFQVLFCSFLFFSILSTSYSLDSILLHPSS